MVARAPQAFLALILSAAQAAPASIGVAVTNGPFRLDGAPVSGNATLFEGSTVETTQASSRLRIGKNARVELAPDSRVKVFAGKADLERGTGQIAGGFALEARSLRIDAAAQASARVRLDGANAVLVSALAGRVSVYNNAGLLVANVAPGTALSLTPQAGAPDASTLSGCLTRRDGRYVLTDTTANLTVELRAGPGINLDEQAGKRIEISGTAFRSLEPVAGASQVIRVDKLKAVPGEACAAVPGVAAKPPKSSSSPSTTSSAPAKVATAGGAKMSNGAIIALVAVGGAGAAGAAIALGGGSKSR